MLNIRGGYLPHTNVDLSNLLKRVWHFRHLSPSDLRTIISSGKIKRFKPDNFIFQTGEPSAGMFVLLSGKVYLCKTGAMGQEQIIATIVPVIMFNELTVIDGGPNPYTAIAAKNCITWNIDCEAFQDLVRSYPDPEIGLGLLRVLASRTRLLIDRCDDLSSLPVMARTAKLLLELSSFGKKPILRREYPIRDLAAHIASVPEVISRSLKQLKEDGLIDYDRKEIALLDIDQLKALAQITPIPTFVP
jgi:CRP/FNR family transcriptional regulator